MSELDVVTEGRLGPTLFRGVSTPRTLVARTALLALIYMAAATAAVFAVRPFAPAVGNWLPADPWAPAHLGLEYVVALLYAAAIALPILRSRWSEWRTVLAVFWVMTGTVVVLPWVEVLAFGLREVGPAGLGATFVATAIAFAMFAPAAVAVHGKLARTGTARRRSPAAAAEPGEENRRLSFGPWGWAWRLVAISIVYLVLYFVFGGLIWFLSPELRAFYESTPMPGGGTLVATQLGRGLLWAAVAVPVVRMMRGPRWETVLAVGVLFGVVQSAALLLPNPLLAAELRRFHLFETASSNFLLGLFVGWVLTPRRTLSTGQRATPS